MNLPQRVVLAVAAIIVAGMVLFPPWLLIYDPPKSEDFTKTIRPAGYHSIFAPPVPEDKTELERIFGLPATANAPSYASSLYFFSMVIDKDRLMIQLVGVLAISVLLFLLLKARK